MEKKNDAFALVAAGAGGLTTLVATSFASGYILIEMGVGSGTSNLLSYLIGVGIGQYVGFRCMDLVGGVQPDKTSDKVNKTKLNLVP